MEHTNEEFEALESQIQLIRGVVSNMFKNYRWYRNIGHARRASFILALFDLPILRNF